MKKFTFTFGLLTLAVAVLFAQDPKTMTIEKQPGDIVIDGVGDETSWGAIESHEITNHVTEAPESEFDFSATFKVLWNDTALFFLVEASDLDIYAYNGWGTDGVEFYFQFGNGVLDNNNLFGQQEYGYYQVPFRLTNKAATGGYQQDTIANQATTVINDTEGKYVIEGYMAFRQFTNEEDVVVSPADEYTFAFDVNVADNDEGIDQNSGVTRNYWSATSHLFDGTDVDDLIAKWETAGIATLSAKTVAIQNPTSLAKFTIYPNPVQSSFEITGTQNLDRVEITSVLGKRMMSVDLNNSKRVDVSELPTGIYFVSFYNEGRLFGAKKLIKK